MDVTNHLFGLFDLLKKFFSFLCYHIVPIIFVFRIYSYTIRNLCVLSYNLGLPDI